MNDIERARFYTEFGIRYEKVAEDDRYEYGYYFSTTNPERAIEYQFRK